MSGGVRNGVGGVGDAAGGVGGGAGGGVTRRDAIRITAAASLALAFGGGVGSALFRRARLERVSDTRPHLGTLVTIAVVHDDAALARSMVEATFAEVARLEGILSRHRADTPVARLAREGEITHAPVELRHVVGAALGYAELTGGAFDPTVAPLLDAYRNRSADDPFGDGSLGDGSVGDGSLGNGPPDRGPLGNGSLGDGPLADDDVARALALVDWRRVTLDRERGSISFTRPGMAITLDGIAKGYVVDRAVATLVGAGADRVLVEAGGDLAVTREGPDGGRWPVAIQDPHDAARSLGTLRLSGVGVATSGDYVQAFTQDRRHHHILDPRTGRSPDHTSGVTVVAATAMDADALSTSAFVMGPEEGLALLERLDRVEGLIVTKDGREFATSGFRPA